MSSGFPSLIYFVYMYIKFNGSVASMGQTDTLVSVMFSFLLFLLLLQVVVVFLKGDCKTLLNT